MNLKIASAFIVFALELVGHAQTESPNLVGKPRVNEDGSQIYRYRNGESCLKRADYAKSITASGTVKITQVFQAQASYATKIENAKNLSLTFQELDASFFDLCQQYGEGILSLQEYKDDRKAYDVIRQQLVAKEIAVTKEINQNANSNNSPSTSQGPTSEKNTSSTASPTTGTQTDKAPTKKPKSATKPTAPPKSPQNPSTPN